MIVTDLIPPKDECANCGCELVFNADHAASCAYTNLRYCSAEQLPRATVEALSAHFERLDAQRRTLELAVAIRLDKLEARLQMVEIDREPFL